MRDITKSEQISIAASQMVTERNYWLSKLSGEWELSRFPYDNNKPVLDEKESPTLLSSRITGDLFEKLMKLNGGSLQRLHIILVTAVIILLKKYTRNSDIIIATPIYKQEIMGDFVNTVLVLRNQVSDDITFKELLLQVRKTIVEAVENQNYPLERLLEQLGIPGDTSWERAASLFDTVVLLENIHERQYLKDVRPGIIFLFSKCEDSIDLLMEYDSHRYEKATAERIARHLENLLKECCDYINSTIDKINILSKEEKEQILYHFNNPGMEQNRDAKAEKFLHRLFEEQVIRTPYHTAVKFENHHLVYADLNLLSGRLANWLNWKDVKLNCIVGVMMERSLEMIIALLGILKAGGAYLPIDPEYPQERIDYMLKDSGAKLLAVANELESEKVRTWEGELLAVANGSEGEKLRRWEGEKGCPRRGLHHSSFSTQHSNPFHLCYIIYTSGSTGKPKGVAVQHHSIVNTILWRKNYYRFDEKNIVLQIPSFSFDSSVEDIFTPLISGAKIVLMIQEHRLNMEYFQEVLVRNSINHFLVTPSLYKILLREMPGSLESQEKITIAGEHFTEDLVKDHFKKLPYTRLFNEYGPTENSVCSTVYEFSPDRTQVIIGKPIDRIACYILDSNHLFLPIGVPGELCLSGAGLARGYLNEPELTAERFPFVPSAAKKIYKTGDLVRWLADGNIEFLGRLDHQVKVRGFRIELGEIESQLLKYEEINEAVVVPKSDETGDKHLCAYIVVGKEFNVSQLREFLSGKLPDYMIPGYFVPLERIPLTPNGKVDRKSLPEPKTAMAMEAYVPPQDNIEEKLVHIWSEVLAAEDTKISTNANFFQLGGHSLRVTVMLAKIQKTLNVKLPLAQVFKNPTIKGLSNYIKELTPSKYISLEPTEKKEYYPLSSAQRRLYVLKDMDARGISYNIPSVLMLEGEVNKNRLEGTFKSLIKRHESLRTTFHMIADEPVQRIHEVDDVEFEIEYYDLATEDTENTENKIHHPSFIIHHSFIRPFDFLTAPLLRVGLIKEEEKKCLLMIDMHHIISDGVSIGLLIREFMLFYDGKYLPHIKVHYKDFSGWQNSKEVKESIKHQKEYWLKEFESEIPVMNLPCDFPRPVIQSFEGRVLNFEIDKETALELKAYALEEGKTLFMVLLSAYNVLLQKLSSQEDIVVGTPIAGRSHADLEHIVGMFVNTLVLRNFPVGEKSFKGFLDEVKARTLDAFENQDYPYEDFVESVALNRDAARNPLFDTVFVLQNIDIPEIEIPGLTLKPYDYNPATAKFDLTLQCFETEEKLLCSFGYSTKLFKKATIERFKSYFEKTISIVIENSAIKISDIEILSEEEKRKLLHDFNNTGEKYPREKILHQLFRDQVKKTPHHIVLVSKEHRERGMESMAISVTYKELNHISRRLAGVLKGKGVKPDTITGLMVERSLEMIIGILGILKAGGAYVPLNPKTPASRNGYLLKECSAEILLTTRSLFEEDEKVGTWEGEKIFLEDRENVESFHAPCSMSRAGPGHLAYVIFTSGSTGSPKGVPIAHANLSPLLHWGYRQLRLGPTDRVIENLSSYFDWSVMEIFITITTGAGLIITSEEVLLNPQLCAAFIDKQNITALHVTPSQYQYLVQIDRPLETLQYLFIGGEKLTLDLAKHSFQLVKEGCRVFNVYGPTECAINTSLLELDAGTLDVYRHLTSVPIGPPAANVDYLVLDKYLKPCPIMINGELYIAGDGLAPGYISDPEKTFNAFVPNIYEGEGIRGSRLYKTGDMARWLPDGNVEYLGRLDHQVKIRGYRIELGEIESQLLKHQNVRDAVVLVNEDAAHDKYICAYLVPGQTLSTMELKQYLAQQLPDYMIPSYFVQIEKIPLNPNGKLDRKALPVPDPKAEGEYKAPGNDVETKLVEIWAEVLGIKKDIIGIDANFFQLGGHSLKAAVVFSKIHKELEVKIPLVEIFTNPTVRELAECINGLTEEQYKAIEPVEKKDYYAVSSGQRRLYVLQQMIPESTVYNMPLVISLGEEADTEKLETTFIRLIERHESFRASFLLVNGEPVQRIHGRADFKIERPEGKEVKSLISNFVRAFDLSRTPLLRAGFLETGDGTCLLVVDMHHIVSDGVSLNILVQDFTHLYPGGNLTPLLIQYKDFAEWQTLQSQRESMNQQESFWLKTFKGEIPLLNLPIDYPRPMVQSFAGDTVNFEISTDDTAALKALALESDVTLYMVLLAIFNILLSKLTGQEDIIIGTTIAGRRHADLGKIIGMFVNTSALRNFPNAEKSIKEFLREVKDKTLETFENQEYPFEELVEKVDVERDTGRNPLFDVMFSLQNIFEENETGIAAKDSPFTRQNRYQYENRTAKFDLTFAAVESEGRLLMGFQYCTSLFKKETIERFCSYFKKIAAAFPQDHRVKLKQIEITSEVEKQRIMYDFNNTDAEYPRDKTIHQIFAEQVSSTPDNVALVFQDKKLTYEELNRESNQLAGLLKEKGIKTQDIVGVLLNRNLEIIVSILAVLKAGGGYLPIDPDYPGERIKYILEDSGTKILLSELSKWSQLFQTVEAIEPAFPDLYPDVGLVTYDGGGLNRSPAPGAGASPHGTGPSDLAYVIYTSGTTGRPKGAMIEHRNVIRLMFNDNYLFDFNSSDTWTMFHSPCFDFSVWEMYGALLYGGKLILISKMSARDTLEFLGILKAETVTVLNQTPAAFYNLAHRELRNPGKNLHLKYVIFGGEALKPAKLKQWKKKYPETKLINMFGITETTVHVTYKELEDKEIECDISNIGKPIPTLSTYVMDEVLNLVPIGVTGELCVGGEGVGRGYLNRPELIKEKFLTHPHIPNQRIYRSGDLGRYLENGEIEYLGRIDHQVKIRGFRIEPGEIESQLLKVDKVKEAVVIAGKISGGSTDEDDESGSYLCAYIVPETNPAPPISELRNYLSDELPDYMIPSYFVFMDKIPLTANGKIDRKALPGPVIKTEEEYNPPAGKTEKKLAGIWSDVLGIEKDMIGIDADFFQLGGHSLKATALTSRIQKEFNVVIPLVEIFQNPTIKSLSGYMEKAVIKNLTVQDDRLILLKPGVSGDKHLFLIHDGTGEVEGYIEFCQHSTLPFNYWGIRAHRLRNLAPRHCTIQELAREYIEKIKKVQPQGPYFIAGWSLGGTIAFEMVFQLEKSGEKISFLGLVDSPGPQEQGREQVSQFNMESELAWVWEYLPDNEIKEKVKKSRDINETWTIILNHMEENQFSVEFVKQLIPDRLAQIIPNYNQLGIKELIYYLNLNRTLTNARAFYIPSQKIHTPLHYFKAHQSPGIFRDHWNEYCHKSIKSYEIPGDHFSIFNKPNVAQTTKIFNNVMLDIIGDLYDRI